VAVSLFKDRILKVTSPFRIPLCHHPLCMDEGKKVYFDADHHDCLVGVHHASIVPVRRRS